MGSIIKVNEYKDFGNNAIMTSDGSGNLTTQKISEPYFYAYLTAVQSIANTTYTKANLDAVLYNEGSGYNTSSYRFTVPSGKAGKYLFSARMKISGIDDNEASNVLFYKNGSVEYSSEMKSYSPGGDNQTIAITTYTFDLSVGDYVEMYVRHSEGSSRDLFAGTSDGSWFIGQRIGS
jgi:hypothetical protein